MRIERRPFLSGVSNVPLTKPHGFVFEDEFAGSTFSPVGHTLFVDIQASRDMMFAIWGPWHRIGV